MMNMDASVKELIHPEREARTRSAKRQLTKESDSKGESIDQDKLVRAASLILEAIGENLFREGLRETPARFARMIQEICYGVGVDASSEITCTFKEGSEGLVVVKDIGFSSLCEHHLVPFIGKAHIAYLPKDGVVTGLSKLARVVELASKRPQVQERMCEEIACAIDKGVNPLGVVVLLEAEHFCMSMRGIKKPGAKTVTIACRGILKTDRQERREALDLIRDR